MSSSHCTRCSCQDSSNRQRLKESSQTREEKSTRFEWQPAFQARSNCHQEQGILKWPKLTIKCQQSYLIFGRCFVFSKFLRDNRKSRNHFLESWISADYFALKNRKELWSLSDQAGCLTWVECLPNCSVHNQRWTQADLSFHFMVLKIDFLRKNLNYVPCFWVDKLNWTQKTHDRLLHPLFEGFRSKVQENVQFVWRGFFFWH